MSCDELAAVRPSRLAAAFSGIASAAGNTRPRLAPDYLTAGCFGAGETRIRRSLLGIALTALTALTACTTSAERPSTAPADSGIENRRWLLVELNGQPVATVGAGEPVYLELDGEQSRVAGNAPCNRFSGSYELTAGNRLQFAPNIVATRRACPELDLEGEFFAMLPRVDTYALADGVLELQRTGAPLARFRAAD